jgi:hypothetical protein
MHVKLNPDFITPVTDWSVFVGDLRYSYNSFGVDISYYDVANLEQFRGLHKLSTLLPIEPDWIEIAIMTGKGHLYPHRDHGTSVSLNYYAQTSGIDTTNFYYAKTDAKPHTYPGKTEANCYSYDDVVMPPYESFVAQPNEAYLFRCKNIHDVEKLTDEPRIMLCYQWATKNFLEVKKGLGPIVM